MISFSLLESWLIREAGFWILTRRKQWDLGALALGRGSHPRQKSIFAAIFAGFFVVVTRASAMFINSLSFVQEQEFQTKDMRDFCKPSPASVHSTENQWDLDVRDKRWVKHSRWQWGSHVHASESPEHNRDPSFATTMCVLVKYTLQKFEKVQTKYSNIFGRLTWPPWMVVNGGHCLFMMWLLD